MTRLTKFSLIVLLLFPSFLQAQKLSSFEVNGNNEFDDETYFQWSKLSVNQTYFNGIVDSVKNRISSNLLINGYYFFKYNSSELIISNDSTKFDIKIDIIDGKTEAAIISNSDLASYITGINLPVDGGRTMSL